MAMGWYVFIFAIKVPMWPFLPLPDAHVEAPNWFNYFIGYYLK